MSGNGQGKLNTYPGLFVLNLTLQLQSQAPLAGTFEVAGMIDIIAGYPGSVVRFDVTGMGAPVQPLPMPVEDPLSESGVNGKIEIESTKTSETYRADRMTAVTTGGHIPTGWVTVRGTVRVSVGAKCVRMVLMLHPCGY
jgi:hypothetical protein